MMAFALDAFPDTFRHWCGTVPEIPKTSKTSKTKVLTTSFQRRNSLAYSGKINITYQRDNSKHPKDDFHEDLYSLWSVTPR